jgi:phenylalanyl-tRNA synthetase beta chain
MRTSLLPGLVAALGRNVARQQPRVRLFELGNVFHAAGEGEAPRHTQRVAGVACGAVHGEQWAAPARAVGFHDVKGDVESLAALSGATLAYVPSTRPWGHPGRSADVMLDGAVVGWIGQLHPRLQQALGLDVEAVAFEVDLDAVRRRELPRAQGLSRYPSVRRDLAFVLPDATTWAAVDATVRAVAGPSLRELVLFDVYRGKGVENGFKSVAMGLILQEKTRTLTDRDVDAVVGEVIASLQREHGATIRS